MRVTWVNPGFSDYRVPVYAALDELLEGHLTVVFSKSRTSPSVANKLKRLIGQRAVGLLGETKLWSTASGEGFANKGIHIPYQPGLLKAISKSQPDVIITEGFFQWTPASLFFRVAHRIPLVVAYERTAHTERNAGMFRLAYRRLVAKWTDAIACNGTLSREFCTTFLSYASNRIVTGAMAADTTALSKLCGECPTVESRTEKKRIASPAFLYVGRLIRLKGLRELLEAWARFTREESQAGSLTLVGDGPERDTLEQMSKQLGLRDVHFEGRVSYDSIARYYAAADALVMPTLEDNWSLVVPEAMACGLPILCSQFNGCWPELVREDVNGWIFDPNNIEQLSGLFRKATSDISKLPKMGQASQEIVARFTPLHAAQAVLDACVMACQSRGRRKSMDVNPNAGIRS